MTASGNNLVRFTSWNPFGDTRYLCPVVDPVNSWPVYRAVQIVGVYRCGCSDGCGCSSDFVSLQVVGSDVRPSRPFRFPFSQLVRFQPELEGRDVLVR